MNQVIDGLSEKAAFVFDRGYNMNALFHFMYKQDQDFIVRLMEKRNLFWKGKWFKSTVLRDSRKGKIRTTLTFREDGNERKEIVYISPLNIKITASKNPVNLVLVYGLGDTPMMLATNKVIRGKEDVIQIVITPGGGLKNISVLKNNSLDLKTSALEAWYPSIISISFSLMRSV